MQDMSIRNIHAHDGTRRHGVHPDAAEDGGERPDPRREDGHPHVHIDQMDEAYDVFKNAAEHHALKVVITPPDDPGPAPSGPPPRSCERYI